MQQFEWKLTRVPDAGGATGEEISRLAYDDTRGGWFSAVVPGTVLTSYLRAGRIDDPYYSDNIEKLDQAYYNVDYWYRARLRVPAEPAGRRTWLCFDGIHRKADIFLNGERIGEIGGAFLRGRFDVTQRARPGEEAVLAVYIHWCDANLLDTPTFIGSAGWDFMPAIPGRNIGLYRDVYLEATGDARLVDPFVRTELAEPGLDAAEVKICTEIANEADAPREGVLCGAIEPGGMTFRQPVALPARGVQTLELPPVHLERPRLWWPVDLGEPNLYTLTLTLEIDGRVSDRRTVSFGVRKFDYDREGHDLRLRVNGVPVLCKGGNWGMPDAMLGQTPAFLDASVRMHREMHFNMIRTWHGTSDFEEFYDACDKYGVMVFEDFALHGKQAPHDPPMLLASARDKIRRLRNRACIALWCGENEAVPPKPLDVQLPEACAALDGTRLYIAASNCDGVRGGITYTVQQPAWFFRHAAGFTTEIGAQAVPAVESMRRMMKESELWPPENPVWQLHDYNFGIGNKISEKYTKEITARYGAPTGIEDFCRKAQLLNLETYKAMFEAWNDRMWNDCSGILLWMSAPAWPSLIWQTYDYYLDAFGTYYGSKHACEPVHVQWNAETGEVKVINHTPQPLCGVTAETEVYCLDGRRAYANRVTLDAPPCAATKADTLFAPQQENLALGKPAFASSCAGEAVQAGNVTDGTEETRWTSGEGQTEWLCVDLQTEEIIDGVQISWENAYAADFGVETSVDGAAFEEAATVCDGVGGCNTLHFQQRTARYVRVVCTRRGTIWPYSIYQLRVLRAREHASEMPELSDTHFIKLRLRDAQGALLSENFYWRSLRDCDYTSLAQMPQAALKTRAKMTAEGMRVEIRNASGNIAVGVRLKAAKAGVSGDDRILPAFYDDNYFSLLPGETREICIRYAPQDGAHPCLVTEGFNAPRRMVAVTAE